MAIPQVVINEIRERADIVEIIDTYVPLKKTGRNFKALCPFHPEKTASFIVSPDKQIFHCFGCGEGGNIFHFLMKYQNLSFFDAVRQVAGIVGIEIKEEKGDSLSKQIFELNEIAMEFYSQRLETKEAKICNEYLNKRGITHQIIKLFKLGYAPSNWDSLTKFLITKGYDYDLLLKAGLILKSIEGSSYYDLFRDRLILPIIDHRNKVLGFGARTLSDTMPKYLNSPETIVYKKSNSLYGLNVSLPSLTKQRVAIIVEGYFDVISLYQSGITNVVASSGTALTGEQARFLKKYVEEIIIVYDGDIAGQFASLRGLDIVFESGIKAKAVILPKGYDPDSYVKAMGKEGFLKLLELRQEVFDYKFNVLLNYYGKDSLDARLKVVNEMLLTLDKVSDYLIKAEYMKRLSEVIGFDEKVLWDQYNVRIKRGLNRVLELNRIISREKYAPVEATIIYIMLTRTDLIPELKELLSPGEFITEEIQKLVEKIYSFYPIKGKFDLGNLMNLLSEQEAKLLSEIMAQDMEFNEEVLERFFSESIAKLKILRIEKYCKFLESEIKKAQESKDSIKATSLLKELNEMRRKETKV